MKQASLAPPPNSQHEIGPGQVLGRYELLMPIAAGGMAMVWAARLKGARGFRKIVAVKTITLSGQSGVSALSTVGVAASLAPPRPSASDIDAAFAGRDGRRVVKLAVIGGLCVVGILAAALFTQANSKPPELRRVHLDRPSVRQRRVRCCGGYLKTFRAGRRLRAAQSHAASVHQRHGLRPGRRHGHRYGNELT